MSCCKEQYSFYDKLIKNNPERSELRLVSVHLYLEHTLWHPIKLTNKELNSLLDDCQSVKKTIKVSGGRTKYIWKRRVILNSDGNPIGIEQYIVQSGERIFLTPIKIERNTREEVKVAKANYAEEMKRKFESNWKSEKRGATIKLTSFRQLSMLLK